MRIITRLKSTADDIVDVKDLENNFNNKCCIFFNDRVLFAVDIKNEEKMALINNIIHEMLADGWVEEIQ
jgi:hypothetical protein